MKRDSCNDFLKSLLRSYVRECLSAGWARQSFKNCEYLQFKFCIIDLAPEEIDIEITSSSSLLAPLLTRFPCTPARCRKRAMETVRLKLVLAYQGTNFSGWQYQPEGYGRSVQACLEAALATLAGCHVRANGASRTDAGVHALMQLAHADVPATKRHLPWQRALNAILPKDMTVVSLEEVDASFQARNAAMGKIYTYTLWHENAYLLPQRRPFVWAVGPLDFAAMEAAAAVFVGRHDFAAFQNAGTIVNDTIRTVEAITRRRDALPGESVWEISGPGFLKQMVRNIMGCLVTVGRGKANADSVRLLLTTGNRALAPATAPAQGLCLERMEIGSCERQRHQTGDDSLEHDPDQEGLGGAGGVEPH